MNPTALKEDSLIHAIRTGDPVGLKEVYRKYLPGIQTLVTRNGGTRDDAFDIFQDALMVLFEKVRDERFQLTSSFYTLLYGICRNLWGNKLQKRSRSETDLPEQWQISSGEEWQELIVREEMRSIFWSAFQKLGEDCRALLQLFFEKVSMEEIARIMGYAGEGYAKKRKFQCKEHLIRLVREDHRYPDYALPG